MSTTSTRPTILTISKLKHEDLHRHIDDKRQLQNPTAPLFMLLDELVVYILLILRDDTRERNFKWGKYSMNFCSQWRHIGLNAPTLWTKVGPALPEPLEILLVRSGSAALDIEWQDLSDWAGGPNYEESLPLLANHLHRAQSLVWGTSTNDRFATLVDVAFASSRQTPHAPLSSQLSSLDLTFSPYFPVHHVHDLLAWASSLEKFALTIKKPYLPGVRERTTFQPGHCQQSGIRHLVLRSCHRFPMGTTGMTPLPSIFFALESLVLCGEYITHNLARGTLIFPSLILLTLESVEGSEMHDFMEGIRSPKIRSINCHDLLSTEANCFVITLVTKASVYFIERNGRTPFLPSTVRIKCSHNHHADLHVELQDDAGRRVHIHLKITTYEHMSILYPYFFDEIPYSSLRTLDLGGDVDTTEVLAPRATSAIETLILANLPNFWQPNLGPTSTKGKPLFSSLRNLVIFECKELESALAQRCFKGSPIPRLIRRGFQPSYSTLQYWLWLGLAGRIELESGEEVKCWEDEPEAEFTDSDSESEGSVLEDDPFDDGSDVDHELDELGVGVLHPSFSLFEEGNDGSGPWGSDPDDFIGEWDHPRTLAPDVFSSLTQMTL